MIIAIQPDDYTSPGLPDGSDASSPRWAKFLEEKGVSIKWVNVFKSDILDQLEGVDGFMWRWPHWGMSFQVARRIIPVIENILKIPCYPNWETCWHYDDKVLQKMIFEVCSIPMPKTWVFFDKDEAMEWLKGAIYPVVLKLSRGASSGNVRLIASEFEAVQWVNRIFDFGATSLSEKGFEGRRAERIPAGARLKVAARALVKGKLPGEWKCEKDVKELGYVYFQEFLAGNEYDTRITVIGGRAFGFKRANRKGDFRASGSGDIDFDPKGIDLQFVELAFDVAAKLKSESCAIDGMYRNGKPVIGEVSYTYASWAIHECPGYWVRASEGQRDVCSLKWVDGSMWPEVAQAEVFWGRLMAARNVE